MPLGPPTGRPLASLPMSSNGEPQDEAPQSQGEVEEETPYTLPEPEWDWEFKGGEPPEEEERG